MTWDPNPDSGTDLKTSDEDRLLSRDLGAGMVPAPR